MTATPKTTVDPNGIAKLYLRKHEILPYFDSLLNFCQKTISRTHQRYWMIISFYTLFGSLAFINICGELEFADEDEGGLIIMAFLVLVGILITIFVFYAKAFGNTKRLRGKGKILHTFFSAIMDDIKPESGVKGILDHRKQQKSHIYKTKTSPNSGAAKEYFKYPWGIFKMTLVDGSTLKIKCEDKLKQKSGSTIRFQETQKGQFTFNPLVYESQEPRKFVPLLKVLASNEDSLIQNAQQLGETMASRCKTAVMSLTIKQKLSKAPTRAIQARPVGSQNPQSSQAPLQKVKQYLFESSLMGLHYEEKSARIEILYQPVTTRKAQAIIVTYHQPPKDEAYILLKMAVGKHNPNEAEALLRANATLAYGRFALESAKGQSSQVYLVKTLLYETLDREELDTAIHGFASLGATLANLTKLPDKLKAYKFERDTGWESKLLEKSLRGLNAQVIETENKFKIMLPLPDNRQQAVHVRFDRQDPEGNQLIAIQSYCGIPDPQRYKVCLEANGAIAYGAISIGKLGEQDMFMVTDNQLAQTADHQELKKAIFQVATKGDQLEKVLSGQDVY